MPEHSNGAKWVFRIAVWSDRMYSAQLNLKYILLHPVSTDLNITVVRETDKFRVLNMSIE